MQQSLILLVLLLNMGCDAQHNEPKTISKNKMTVQWHYENDRIYFEISAPTKGWVTIGFNPHSGIAGTYLLMGNIINNKANLIEHYTESPGNYAPLTEYGTVPQVDHIEGTEISNHTSIRFSLPSQAYSSYQKDLSEDQTYYMIMAYSQEDDFQHHSIMRTSVNVKL